MVWERWRGASDIECNEKYYVQVEWVCVALEGVSGRQLNDKNVVGECMSGKAFFEREKVDINNARYFTGGEDLDLTS